MTFSTAPLHTCSTQRHKKTGGLRATEIWPSYKLGARKTSFMSAIAVYLRSENPASGTSPKHSASKTLALLVLAQHAARWTCDKKAIQLLTTETWREVKDRVRRVPLLQRNMPVLHPATYHACTMLSYPPSGQESDARVRQRRLWEGAVRF